MIVSAEQMTLEDLGDDKVQATIVQAEGGPAAEDITAAAEQLAFLTNMAEKLGVAKVGFDAPPVTVTVVVAPPPPSASPIIDVDPGRSDEHNSENAADDGPVLELWAVALIAVGGAAALLCLGACCICRRRRGACAAIAATRCKRPSVESCRDCG